MTKQWHEELNLIEAKWATLNYPSRLRGRKPGGEDTTKPRPQPLPVLTFSTYKVRNVWLLCSFLIKCFFSTVLRQLIGRNTVPQRCRNTEYLQMPAHHAQDVPPKPCSAEFIRSRTPDMDPFLSILASNARIQPYKHTSSPADPEPVGDEASEDVEQEEKEDEDDESESEEEPVEPEPQLSNFMERCNRHLHLK
jgi:hypothetical protein